MLTKLLNWLLGKQIATTVGGVMVGAATGAGAAAASGQLSKEQLIAGAVTGAAAALAGVAGRGAGEN